MVKYKDTGEYLYYRYLCTTRKQYIVHEANELLYMRRKRGWSTYYMRYWLRLLQCSQSYCHYSLFYSMLHPWGIDHNKTLTIQFYLFVICSTCYIIQVITITCLSHVPYSRTLWDNCSSYAIYNYTYNYIIASYYCLVTISILNIDIIASKPHGYLALFVSKYVNIQTFFTIFYNGVISSQTSEMLSLF